jgi:hypothetical protein
MNEARLLNVQELSMLIGSSIQTIGSWYRWKELNADHELAKLIPEYARIGNRRTRYWRQDDVWKLIEFKQKIPQGRNGIMGEITQKYVKKKENTDGSDS